MLNRELSDDPLDPGINRVLVAAARQSLPDNLLVWGGWIRLVSWPRTIPTRSW
jgi:hypothetical protein